MQAPKLDDDENDNDNEVRANDVIEAETLVNMSQLMVIDWINH